MARLKQLELEGLTKPKWYFGGSLLKNSHAKCKRPLSSKLPVHVILRTKQSVLRQPKYFARVNETVAETARKYGIKIYDYANVGNHLHILLKLHHIRLWTPFIRELTSRLAALFNITGFFTQLPFTRVVAGWRRAYRIARDYMELNRLEALGFISRSEVKTLKDLRDILPWAAAAP